MCKWWASCRTCPVSTAAWELNVHFTIMLPQLSIPLASQPQTTCNPNKIVWKDTISYFWVVQSTPAAQYQQLSGRIILAHEKCSQTVNLNNNNNTWKSWSVVFMFSLHINQAHIYSSDVASRNDTQLHKYKGHMLIDSPFTLMCVSRQPFFSVTYFWHSDNTSDTGNLCGNIS